MADCSDIEEAAVVRRKEDITLDRHDDDDDDNDDDDDDDMEDRVDDANDGTLSSFTIDERELFTVSGFDLL